MISAADANEDTKFFTHHWTMTAPAQPSLRYIHTTASHLDDWLILMKDPANHPYDESARTKVWDDAALEEWRTSTTQKHVEAESKFNALNMLVELDGQVVGGANYFLLPTGVVNIGLLLNQSARGKGFGKLTVRVLIQLAHDMGIERLEAGTMKANAPMRAVMASLKIPETEEIRESPGRGVVGELLYTIPEKVGWEDINLHVEFGAPASE